jgi:hypothetical protein
VYRVLTLMCWFVCVCFQCPERPCPSGTFNQNSACIFGNKGRGGGTDCTCTSCPLGEMIHIDIPYFSSLDSLTLCA